jgi:hypothetical protein
VTARGEERQGAVVVLVLLLSCCSETASATHVPSRAQ